MDVQNRDAKDVVTDGVLSNVAVTAARVDGDRIVAAIRNRGASARTGPVRALLDGRQVAAAEYVAPPGATVEASIAWRAPEAGTLQVVIDDTAGLPADNAWFVALGGASPSKVLIVGADEPTVYKAGGRPAALYLSRALSTSSGEDVEVVSGRSLRRVHGGPAVSSSRGGAAVDPRTRASDAGTADDVREGRRRLVRRRRVRSRARGARRDDGMAAGVQRHRAERTIDARRDRPAPSDLPAIWRPCRKPWPGAVRSRVARRRQRAGQSSRDSRMARLPYSNARLERGRVVLFASDLDRQWNDFPLHPAFVPFALEALRHVDMWPGIAGRRVTTPSPRRRRERHPSQASIETQEIDRLRSMSTRAKARSTGSTPRLSRAWCRDRSRKPRKLPRIQAQQTESRQSYWQYGLAC